VQDVAIDTPLMRQYWEIKNQHRDAILLFRLGDFYEMFFDDAEKAARILDIALTSRDKSSENPVPLCGVPHHSVSGYIARLLEEGHKVAICEQTEDPKLAKGIVRREVVRVISPGMQTDQEGLEPSEVNPLVSLFAGRAGIGLAWLDVSSGEFRVSAHPSFADAEEEVWRLAPREVVLPEGSAGASFEPWTVAFAALRRGVRFERVPDWVYEKAFQKLRERFAVGSLAGFGLTDEGPEAPAAAALLHYVERMNRTELPHLKAPRPEAAADAVQMDRSTRQNLELDRRHGDAGPDRSLFGCLNETETSMGARRLREWLHFPLTDPARIDERLDAVEELAGDPSAREGMRERLRQVYDLERLIGRIAANRADARDLLALRSTLLRVESLTGVLTPAKSALLVSLRDRMDPHVELRALLERSLADDPPLGLREGGIFRDGYDASLDELRALTRGGRQWVAELEARERIRTGIPSLKVGFNRVFGYYLEVTHPHREKVPPDYQRKQTLTNAERYVTPELKEMEQKILTAEERIGALEYDLFERLRAKAAASTRSLQALAAALADLDVLLALSRAAVRHRYVRPNVDSSGRIRIRAGRHPVVERFLEGEPFVPNDTDLDGAGRQILILTGPNMAGKSTIMRQTALIVLLAQVGSFVPADEAEIGVVDRIFTRVGASDDLSRGRSTFMVEMSETANILRNATRRSLVLLDEIGRGTSTFDGLAIAWAVTEALHDRVGAKTIFATHYHELTDLSRLKPRVFNMNVAVQEWGEKIVFLRTLSEGAVNRSYGIDVARLAGVPDEVIARAREILGNLERGELDALGNPALAAHRDDGSAAQPQLELFKRIADELLEELTKTDPDALTPRAAHDLLYAWRARFKLRG
jgi:DNA mismatch repair protein MutS